MQVQRKPSQNATIEALQQQIDALTTEKMLLEEQLSRKEQFIAMIAHELRGPLSPIINYSQMLSRHKCTPEEGQHSQHTPVSSTTETAHKPKRRTPAETWQKQTKVIIGQAKRMARLVNDL